MAHFAQLDENNKVIWVTPIDNSIITDENGIEQEELGIQYILNTIPDSEKYTWKQTSYNHNFRGKYAGFGDIYLPIPDKFVAPTPHNGWILNETLGEWESPIPMPNDGEKYRWNEFDLNWELDVFD